MSETPETDAARMFGYGEFGGDWVALERRHYEKHPEGDVVFCEVAKKLERERDEARMKWREAWDGWNEALEERNEARKGWSKALEERDEARRELDLVSDKLCKSESAYLKNEEIIDGLKNEIEHTETFFREKLSRAADDVNEAKRERDEAMNALEWIVGAYCHEKSTFQLAQRAYEMSSKARWTLQEIEQKEEA